MEEINSILLKLCSHKTFDEIFSRFSKGAAFVSPSLDILQSNESFNNIPPLKTIISPGQLTGAKKDAQIIRIDKSGVSGFLQFLPIIYNNEFLGYTVIFIPGNEEQNIYELNAARHDLNNLLTLVLNLISFSDQSDIVSEGISITKDFLSGFTLGGTEENEKLFIYDALNLIYHTFSASHKGKAEFKSNIPANLHPVRINKSKFIRVLTNLLTNAVEAIETSGTVSVTAFNLAENGKDFVCVCVADNGKGIPEETIKNIYDKEYSTKQRGSGLGLSIVKKILDEMNGAIDIKSRANEGTKFILKFPSVNDRKRIAIIKDEKLLNEVLTSQFNDDYIVDSYLTGESFMENFDITPLNLVIIDKKLPGINGIECIKRIRKTNKDIKIILASGSGDSDNYELSLSGIDCFVKKPYQFNQLFSAVEELLS